MRALSAACGASLIALMGAAPASAKNFVVNNLVSDGLAEAPHIDPNLINPWGIASGPGGPFWISDNNAGVSTLYNTSGTPLPLVVNIPPPAGGTSPGAPTGVVFNGVSSDFKVGGQHSSFIFSTEDGTISGWSPGVSLTNAILAVDNSTLGLGAVYKGLAIGSVGAANYIYATDFRNGAIDQFDSNFNLVKTFTDPGVAAGYAPFNVQTLGNKLYVTYALQNGAKHDDVAGAGHGYVDVFNLDGSFDKRLVTGGLLNSPWALDIAPSSFGAFAGDLLVGNFGDGTISAYDPNSGVYEGTLKGLNGVPIVIGDLWAITTGNGGLGGNPNAIYFAAGVLHEAHGLFGSISAAPEPATWTMTIFGMGMLGAGLRRRRAEAFLHPQTI
jgi:uncharacterized protein (TIGR03118 family)